MEKIILGIDPGTNIMGYGVLKVMDRKVEMMTMGVIDLRKFGDGYLKLGHIFERVTGIIDGDQDGHHRQWSSLEGAGGRYAAATAEV